MAAGTFLLEANEAICSCQIMAARHPGPLLPIYISQRAEPTTPIEPCGGRKLDGSRIARRKKKKTSAARPGHDSHTGTKEMEYNHAQSPKTGSMCGFICFGGF